MKNQRAKCPHCSKICNSKAGMSMHVNSMHLVLSPSQEEQATKPQCKKCGRSGIALNDGICMRCGLPLSDIDKFLIEAIKNKSFYYAGDNYTVEISPEEDSKYT